MLGGSGKERRYGLGRLLNTVFDMEVFSCVEWVDRFLAKQFGERGPRKWDFF